MNLSKEQIAAIAGHILRSWKFRLSIAAGVILVAWTVAGLFDYFADLKVKSFIGQEEQRMTNGLAKGLTLLNSNVAYQLDQPRVRETLQTVVSQQATQLLLTAVTPTLSNFQATIESKTTEASSVIEAMRDYSEVASLNIIGQPDVTGDVTITTGVSRALEGSYKMEGTKVTFLRDEAAERIFRKVIAEHPRFPFAYWALAAVLSARGDPSWQDYAHQCLAILEKTTKVPAHSSCHDEKLVELKKLIKKGKTGYLIAAFSGGPSESDLKVSKAGLEVLAGKL